MNGDEQKLNKEDQEFWDAVTTKVAQVEMAYQNLLTACKELGGFIGFGGEWIMRRTFPKSAGQIEDLGRLRAQLDCLEKDKIIKAFQVRNQKAKQRLDFDRVVKEKGLTPADLESLGIKQ